ncbi:MAG TPA: Fe-S protein assembly co-chaperone HscB [Oceanospirillaceae bacterium]|nr:Fe-S protein assembly co-chaperone HscB [Oceanospirillaceae bacterium]
MDISQDYFTCYGLPRTFELDLGVLRHSHRALQQEYHPDRFVSFGDAQQRLAVQTTAYLNQAFATLSAPLQRGIYLLQLLGMDPMAPTNTQMPMDFLLQQIELREGMEELARASDPEAAIETLALDLQAQATQLEVDFSHFYTANNYPNAETAVRKLQFIVKLQQQLDALEGELLD